MARNHSVLFICLGNICRSPMAEAVFLKCIQDRNLEDQFNVDSAALIDYHIGKPPYHMTCDVLKKRGIKNYTHKCRQLRTSDFNTFDVIFGMDDENMQELEAQKPFSSKAECKLLGEFDPQGERIIVDPYWNQKASDFEHVYEQCVRCCNGYLDSLKL